MFKSREAVFFCIYLLCKIATFVSADSSPAVCEETEYGRVCNLQSAVETFSTLPENRLLVGCLNSLYSLDTDLQTSSHVDLSPDEETIEQCKLNFNPLPQCNNFVKFTRVVLEDGEVLVCGTNAFRPKCTLHSISNISSYEYMTENNEIDNGFSPYSGDTEITATLTQSQGFYSATKFEELIAPETIRMSPNPLSSRHSMFTVRVPTSNEQWLKQPSFVSVYETQRHVYFFLREPAFEVNQGESVVYSRVVRICKNDRGQQPSLTDLSNNHFLTFQKARIFCSSSTQPGSIPYIYNNLQSTFRWTEPDGEQFIYGVFTSPENGPSGSAICKFSFDPAPSGTLTSVFEDGEYLVLQGTPPAWTKVHTNTFTCPGEPGPQRTSVNASKYLLVYNPVTPMNSQPLHTVLGKRLSKITIDLISYNGSEQTILFFSTLAGDIHQLVIDAEGRKQDNVIVSVGSPLKHLTIRKNDDETRSLYATTGERVMLISRGDCSQHEGCFECLDSRDAYCGWDVDEKKCINKLSTAAPNLLQSFLATDDDIARECGVRNTSPPPPPNCELPASTTEDKMATTEVETCINCTPDTGGLEGNRAAVVSVPDLVGATVGAFVVGIPVGGFVCFIFLKLFIRPRQRKHTINPRRPSGQEEGGAMNQVNNNLNGSENGQQHIQKKDIAMKEPSRYVQTNPVAHTPLPSKPSPLALDPPPPGNPTKRKNSNEKNLNTYLSPEDDQDQVPPLPSVGTFPRTHKSNGYGHTVNGIQRKRVPGHVVPRGRTDSTTWLRANSLSSEPPSPMSPMDSPISDV